jgi:hypothetical protein
VTLLLHAHHVANFDVFGLHHAKDGQVDRLSGRSLQDDSLFSLLLLLGLLDSKTGAFLTLLGIFLHVD